MYRFFSSYSLRCVVIFGILLGLCMGVEPSRTSSATSYPPPPQPVFVMPTTGSMGAAWSGDRSDQHRGIDIWSGRSARCGCIEPAGCNVMPGAEIRAAYDGEVVGIYWGDHSGHWRLPGVSNPQNYPLSVVILKHINVPGIAVPVYTVYQHLANNDTKQSYVAPGLAIGQQIRQHDLLGRQGDWHYYGDNDPITHLHFEVAFKPDTYTLPDRITVDPMPYLIGGGQTNCSGTWITSNAPPALNILRPSQAQPGHAGTPGQPGKVIIEVAYSGTAVAQDFTVSIGNQPATIVSVTPNRFILEVQAPPQPTSGSYDLTVTVKGNSVTAPSAVSYIGTDPNADVILTLDRSGSMSINNKMLAAHTAARQFVDLMQIGDGIGVVGFDNLVTTAFPLTTITPPPPSTSFVFADDLEAGTALWTAAAPWGVSSVAHSGAAAWADSPNGNYANNTNSILAVTAPIMLPVPLATPVLTFWQRYDIEYGYDAGYVEISLDNGATWQRRATYTGNQSDWARAVIDLSAYRAQTIRLRFRLTSDSSVTRDGWYIDDIRIGPAFSDARADAMAAIDTLTSRGSTSIGGGLQRSYQLLQNAAPGRPRAIILLSDGQENWAPYVADVLPQIRASQITVHTIGLGSDADQQQLLSIAAQTGGTYNYAPRPDQLAGIYNTVSGAVSNRQTLITSNGTVAAGAIETRDVQIDSSITDATFWVSWPNSNAQVSLTLDTPAGTRIDAGQAGVNTGIDYVNGTTYAYYRVRVPTLTPGLWRLRISRPAAPTGPAAIGTPPAPTGPVIEQPARVPDAPIVPDAQALPPKGTEALTPLPPSVSADEPFVARVLAKTDLTLGFYPGKLTYLTTESIDCIVTLADQAPILGATVTLTAWLPDQPAPVSLLLYDDGVHNDGAAGDGVYATSLFAPLAPGTATFTVVASGATRTGEPFIRQAEFSTFLAANPNPRTFIRLPSVTR